MARIDVVLDVPTIVAGASHLGPAVVLFPETPPESDDAYADALGVFAFPDDYFALILSEELVEAVATALVSELRWSFDEASHFVEALKDLAEASGGGVARVDRQATVVGALANETKLAARAISAPGLARQRLLVTVDPGALHLGEFVPRGVAFNSQHPIVVESPSRFVKIAQRVRRQMRQAQ